MTPSAPRDGWTPLETAQCSAAIGPLGAILHDLTFHLPGGRSFAPMAEAAWSGTVRPEDLPGLSPHLAELGGEWPCVPFGTSAPDPQHHGYGSNARWQLDHSDGASARMSIDYPAGHDVARLEREVRLSSDAPRAEFTLTVTPARDCLLPIGLHPIFRLPDGGAGVTLDWTGGAEASTVPAALAPAGMGLQPATLVQKGGSLPTRDGGALRFPEAFPRHREALVQIWDCDGEAELRYPDEGAGVRLTWSADDLPHCLLWLANPGTEIPGFGQFTGMGVEPVSSLFDGGVTPFDPSLQGRRAGVQLRAGTPWTTRYEISAFALTDS
ncbi:hypothetical protein [Marinovum sp.]|uniref:hypothetical protein n=1 Tax=Marinovum sp. TaxID=2024839 RepID=UPI002B26B13D|nr:hypothetical protein [Marinovum sp.]